MLGAGYMGLSSGKVLFEVEVLEKKGAMFVGFAGTNFQEERLGKGQCWSIEQDGYSWSRSRFDATRLVTTMTQRVLMQGKHGGRGC